MNRENPIAGKAETSTPPDKGSGFQVTRADDRTDFSKGSTPKQRRKRLKGDLRRTLSFQSRYQSEVKPCHRPLNYFLDLPKNNNSLLTEKRTKPFFTFIPSPGFRYTTCEAYGDCDNRKGISTGTPAVIYWPGKFTRFFTYLFY